jgi:peroxiredoxin
MMSGYQSLPDDLPVPRDDGAGDHLPGLGMASVTLQCSRGGEIDLAELGPGRTILYVYPMTGTPGVALPDGWDEIPGARGCTPESCAFRDHFMQLREPGVDAVFGLSTRDIDTQRAVATRLALPCPLLADPDVALGRPLGLPTATPRRSSPGSRPDSLVSKD